MSCYHFKSCLKSDLEKYIDQRVKDGFSESSFNWLLTFDRFIYEKGYCQSYLSKEIINEWLVKHSTETNSTFSKRISTLRNFCIYLNSIGIDTYIPIVNVHQSKVQPYVLSAEELQLLFNAIDMYFSNRNPITRIETKHYNYMIPVMIRVLYCTGMRINELCSLKFDDFNYEKKRLFIENSKNHKDKYVYLYDDVYNLLLVYSKKIQSEIYSDWLFPAGKSSTHIAKTTIDAYFHKIVNVCEIGNKDHHPTPHSLRHTYTVHRIDSWVKNGEDLNEMMPYLSCQLGHSSPLETYYYYHMLAASFEIIEEKGRDLIPEVTDYEE